MLVLIQRNLAVLLSHKQTLVWEDAKAAGTQQKYWLYWVDMNNVLLTSLS